MDIKGEKIEFAHDLRNGINYVIRILVGVTCSINKASPDPNRIIFAMQDTLCVESHMPLNFGQSLHHVIFLPSQTFDKGLYFFIYLFIY